LVFTFLVLGAIAISGAVADDPPQFQSLTANPSGPQNAGTTITLTAETTGGIPGGIWYRFWMRGPATNNQWAPMTEYTTNQTFSWTTTASDVGGNTFRVWIAGQNYGTAEQWDSYGDASITINPAPTPPPQFQSLTATPSGPQNAGTTITLTATASGGVPGNVWYRFWMRGPATNNQWAPMTGYTQTNTFPWTTTSSDVGGNTFRVWIAGQNYGTAEQWDSYGDASITINPAPTPPPQFQSLTANPSGPQNAGMTINLKAAASGGDPANIWYRFWLRGPATNNQWAPLTGYTKTDTFSWTTTASDVGGNTFRVWIAGQDYGTAEQWDSYGDASITINPAPTPPPQFQSLTATPSGPQNAGTTINLKAAASGGDPANIWYRFWLRGPATNNQWAPVTGYTKTDTFSWTTTASDVGGNTFRVWIAGQDYGTAEQWDSYGDASITINPAPTPPPQFQSLTATPSGPQNAGTTINLKAAASGGDPANIWYRFWLRGPATNNQWVPVTGYTKTDTFSWTTTASDVGGNTFRVWIAGQDYGTVEQWDSYGDASIIINPAPTPLQFQSLTATPSGPQNAGTTINLKATASGGDPANIWYRFWLRGPATNNQWAPVTGYTKTDTFSWTTTASDVGGNTFRVWIAGQNYGTVEQWDSYGDASIIINPAPTPLQFQSLTANPSGPQNAGTTINLKATASGGDPANIWYRFWLRGPATNNQWAPVTGYTKTDTFSWTTTASDVGGNTFRVWIAGQDYGTAEQWDSYGDASITINPAPTPPPQFQSLTATPSGPQNAGTTITLTATASGGVPGNVWYRFWMRGPATNDQWAPMTGYTRTNTFSWTTSSSDVGGNTFRVWIAGQNYGTQERWDSYGDRSITINPSPVPLPQFQSLTASPSGPQNAGTRITLTATASGGVPGNIWYRFWMRGPATNDQWAPMTGYTRTNTFSWTTSSSDVGQNTFRVWIAGQNYGTQERWDSYGDRSITINPAPTPNRPPKLTSFTPDRPSPQIAGARITWTASATDPDGDAILYRFWLRGPSTGNTWKVVRDWSTTRTWTWSTSAGDAGQYDFAVYVRDGKHQPAGRYDDMLGYRGYQLIAIRPANLPPTVTALIPSTPSPSVAGSTIVWRAAATDPDRDTIFYRFWLRGPSTGNTWKVVRDWSTSSTWTWSTSPADAGAYDVYVYVRDGKHAPPTSYDSARGFGGYVLTAPVLVPINQPPVVTALSPNRPSPQAAGSTIVWTASATDPDRDTIFYKFWLRGPSTGDVWKVVRDWSTSSTWTWSTSPADAGAYDVYVYVRDGKHAPATSYDSARGFGGYQLTSVNRPPVVTALTPDRPSPQIAGSTITWTATATDPDGDPIFTRFWLRGPSTGDVWKVVQDWSLSPTWTWSPGYGDAGEYSVYVYVRDANHAPATGYDSARGYSGYQIRGPGGVRQLTSGEAVRDRPSLVFADDGSLLAYQSWEAGPLFRGDIFLKRFDPGWSQIQKVRATSDQAYQDTPSVIYSDGYYYVAYVSDETGNWDIFMKKYDRDLFLVETRRLTTSTADQDSPSLIRVGSDFYLAYQSWETGPSSGGDIFIERFNSAWTSIRKVRVTTEASYQDRPSLTLGGDGRLYVAYVSEETGNKDIFVKKYDRSLNSLEKRRITTSPSVQDYPSLLWHDGVFNLAYSSQEAGSLDLYMERFDPGWRLIDRAQLTGTSGDEVWPTLAFNPSDGLLWVAYVHQDGPGGNIFVRPAISMDSMAICWASMDFSATRAYSPYSLTVKFRGPGGELADPSNLRLTWSPADAVLTSSALRKVSTGTYQLDSRFGAPGQKSFTLSYTLAGCSGESTVVVYVN